MRTKIVLFLSTENYKREHLPLPNTYTGWQVSIHRNHLTFQVNSIGTGSLQYPQKWNSEHIFKNLCPVKSQYYSLIMFWNYKIVSRLFCDFSQWFLDTSNISTFAAKSHTLHTQMVTLVIHYNMQHYLKKESHTVPSITALVTHSWSFLLVQGCDTPCFWKYYMHSIENAHEMCCTI